VNIAMDKDMKPVSSHVDMRYPGYLIITEKYPKNTAAIMTRNLNSSRINGLLQ
jgi:hypothetical protein